MRMMMPVVKTIQEAAPMRDAMRLSRQAVAAEGAVSGVAGGGIMSVITSGLKQFPRLLKSNFLLAAAGSALTGVIDLIKGEKPKTVAANLIADTAAYTGIGATCTMVGGMIGSIIPGIGNIIGVAAGALVGLGLSKLYESTVRTKLSDFVNANVVAKVFPDQPQTTPAAA
jgi:hypothetical protein